MLPSLTYITSAGVAQSTHWPTGSLQDEDLHNKRFYTLVSFYTITKDDGFKSALNMLLEIAN